MGKKFAYVPTASEQIELVRQAKAGDRSALNTLVAGQNGLVRNLALSIAQNNKRAEIDDLVQEGLLAVVDAARWFDPDRGFQFDTYAADCIRRRMGRFLKMRRNQLLPQDEQQLRGEPSAIESALDPHSVEESDSLADRLQRCMSLARLSGPQRQVIEICHREHKRPSYTRISELTGWSVQDVMQLYHSAMSRLLEVFGPDEDEELPIPMIQRAHNLHRKRAA